MEHGGKIVETLIGLGHLAPEDFVSFLSKNAGLASFNLANYDCTAPLISLIPKEFAIEHEVFPIDRLGPLLTVGMACPLDIATIQSLEEMTELRVKPILCTASDIRAAIRRYYGSPTEKPAAAPPPTGGPVPPEGLDAPLRLSNVARLLRLMEKLPALPETVERIRDIMAGPEPETRDIARVVGLDPPVAAKLLGVVNSAAYCLANKVDDLTIAVSLLGIKETYSLVLSCAVVNLLEKSKSLDYRAFWLDSMCCASAARIIAQATGNTQRFGVSAAGLLHDLGRAALSEVAPKLYGRIDSSQPTPVVLEQEEQVFGMTHAEAGYQVANQWGLPIEITEPIRFHHSPTLATQARESVAIVAIADAMTLAMGSAEDASVVFEGLDPARAILNLEMEDAASLWEEFRDGVAPRAT